MKMKITQHCSDQIGLTSLEHLQIDLQLKETSCDIPVDWLFDVAIRKNKKRVLPPSSKKGNKQWP